jgi:TRAP transporter TAXI family solute receptor
MNKNFEIKLAVSGKGDAYKVAKAISEVVHIHNEHITIEVVSTLGSSHSQEMLSQKLVDLAMIQADTKTDKDTRLVSLLYPDIFELIVRDDIGVKKVSDIKGKYIAIADKSSGQYSSFWELMKHYGFEKDDLHTLSLSSKIADFLLKKSQIDGLFRVRPPADSKIKALIKNSHTIIVPITQIKALHFENSAFLEGIIPKGTYNGSPPVPDSDITSVMVYRLLVASKGLNADVVRDITSTLFEQKQQLQSIFRLSGIAKQPDRESSMMPLHEGAKSYYNQDEPTLIEKYLEKFGFLMTIFAILSTVLMTIWGYLQRRRINRYNDRVMSIIKEAQSSQDIIKLDKMATELNEMLEQVLRDKATHKIDHDGFETFSFYWEMARDEVNEVLLNERVEIGESNE